MKILFNDTNSFVSIKNGSVFCNTPEKKNSVLTIKESDSGYCTIIRNPFNNKIHLYYRKTGTGKSVHHSETMVSISDDGIIFQTPQKIFGNKCISHNFTPFYDEKNKIFRGIGGLHISKWSGHFRLCKKHNNCQNHQKLKEHKPNKKGGQKIFDPNQEHDCFGGGLYTLSSNDGIKWTIDSKKSVINGLHKGHTDGLSHCSEFDGGLSCFYDQNTQKYHLYCRSNVAIQHRYIQFTKSNDLKKWDDFKLITTDKRRAKKDNYYYSGASLLPESKQYIALTPYSDGSNQNSGIWLMMSNDGENWRNMSLLINTKQKNNRTSQHSVTGIIESNDKKEMYFYIQDNYFRLNGSHPIQIIRYSIPYDRFCGIQPNDNNECEIIIKINSTNKIKDVWVNMETEEGGYISIKLLDNNMKKINKSDMLVGNELDNKVIWRTTRYIFDYFQIFLYKAKIYSIKYN